MYETNPSNLEAQLAAATDQAHRIEILGTLALLLVDLDMERAYSLINELRILSTSGEFARSPHLSGLAWSQLGLGWYYLRLSEHEQALEHFSDAEDRFARLNSIEGQRQAANGLGIVYLQLARFDRALGFFLKALGTNEDDVDPFTLSGVLNNLGVIYIELDDLEQALNYLNRSLKVSRTLGNKRNQAAALDNQSNVYHRLGKYQKALNGALESLSLSREIKSRVYEAESLNSVGDAHMALGNRIQAMRCFKTALQKSSEIGHSYEKVEAMVRIGTLYLQDGEFETAAAQFHPALSLAQEADAKRLIYESYQALAKLYEDQGEHQLALQYYKLFHTVQSEVFNQQTDWRLKTLQVIHKVETDENLRQSNARLQERLLEIQKLQQQLKDQAIRDPLTGLYNRRYLHETLERELAQQNHSDGVLSVILMDVDRFKEVNDRNGHHAGDEVMIALATLLLAKTHPSDAVYRYGGDEFVIVLPNAAPEDALRLGIEIRKSFAAQTFTFAGQILHLSISSGIASFPHNARTSDGLLHAADEALYTSKIERDQVTLSTRTSTP